MPVSDIRASILIVDDDPANIQVLAACLKDHYQIRVATSGERCLELVEDEHPDLILLDIEMPGMNGYQTCQQLKANQLAAGIPVIFVTGRENEQDEEKGLQLGAVDYITKPIHPAIVQARVKTQIQLRLHMNRLEHMALHDQLTGIYNRHYLLEVASQKVAYALRHQENLSVLMLDLDYFKAVNDEHGHLVADKVLQAVAAVLADSSRKEDLAARYGGEEFVILLEQCNLEAAVSKAEGLRLQIEQLHPQEVDITVSIGAAQLRAGDSNFETLLNRADAAMYQAKSLGRNCVVKDQQKKG